MALESSNLYHVAWVVPHLADAMQSFGAVGLRWASPVVRTINMQTPTTEPTQISISVTYSIDDPMHVELIEHCPNSPWQMETHGTPHHLGWWTDDLRSDIAMLVGEGHQLQSWMVGEDGQPSRFAYLLNDQGVRVELVDRQAEPQLRAWWSGKPYI
jgi:hypothetical protein